MVDLLWAVTVATFLGAVGPTPLRATQSGDKVAFATTVAVQALTFRQGDRLALGRVQSQFTEAGWTQFLSGLQGWLDSTGTPTFGSSFVPSGSGRVVGEENGIVHVRIPGSLTQTQDQSRTTYRVAAADVWVGGDPLKVHRLTQTTCAGASTACQ